MQYKQVDFCEMKEVKNRRHKLSKQIIKSLIPMLLWIIVSSCAISATDNYQDNSSMIGKPKENQVSKSSDNSTGEKERNKRFESIEDYLLLNPDWKNEAWRLRAELYMSAGNENPNESLEFYSKGVRSSKEKRYSDAISYYKKSMDLDPFFPWSANNIAWEYATCPDPNIRDGNKAVEYARIAIQKPNTLVADFSDTLAAAYAAKGDFKKAVHFCEEAQKIFPTANRKMMLKKFRANQIFVDYSDPPVKDETTFSKGYGKTKWGMTKLFVLSLYPEAKFNNNDLLILPEAEIAGLNAKVSFHFFNDMLYKTVINLEKTKISDVQKKYLENNLIKDYGHPNLIIDDNEFNWENSDSTIRYIFYKPSYSVNIVLANKKIGKIISERDKYLNSQLPDF